MLGLLFVYRKSRSGPNSGIAETRCSILETKNAEVCLPASLNGVQYYVYYYYHSLPVFVWTTLCTYTMCWLNRRCSQVTECPCGPSKQSIGSQLCVKSVEVIAKYKHKLNSPNCCWVTWLWACLEILLNVWWGSSPGRTLDLGMSTFGIMYKLKLIFNIPFYAGCNVMHACFWFV